MAQYSEEQVKAVIGTLWIFKSDEFAEHYIVYDYSLERSSRYIFKLRTFDMKKTYSAMDIALIPQIAGGKRRDLKDGWNYMG